MRRITLAAVVAAFALAVAASPASAQQEGLVNVAITDNTVQVPVAVAANVCDVDVNVLASDIQDGSALCNADADSFATSTRGGGGGGGGPQSGLINIDISDNTVQVPISVAANVCDLNVGVLVQNLRDGNSNCAADGVAVARG
jgi:L-aminopeptidase/D-esterase-like protein